ncbi:hypothetical protein TRVA0_001S01134 [Trichomonascus vanleenenianus]|uniref:Lug1p n=1 Tax=Trichomonascus vanleenenianus TaxID=2268995 RepID=UPI003EC98CDD
MPSYDNLAGIYFDTQDQILPLTGNSPATSSYREYHHQLSRRPSADEYSNINNIHDGLEKTTFFHSSSNLSIAGNRRYQVEHYKPPSQARINTMPPEIMTHILQQLLITGSEDATTELHVLTRDFARILPTCFAFYDAGIPILYRHVSFPHSKAFDKFRHSIERTGYGALVKVLDFSAFTSVGLGRTARMNVEIQMVTSTTILKALDLCPGLKEFLVAESVDMDIDVRVLDKLASMPYLDAIDFCGSTSSAETGFTKSLVRSQLVTAPEAIYNLTRVSFHGCPAIPPSALEALLPRLCNVMRLDLTHTQVTPHALLNIPSSARLTHLSLAKCVQLTSNGLMSFLTMHPATRYLEWLNLMFEATKPVPLSQADFETVLRYLPPLRYLNLHGLPVKASHFRHFEQMELRALSLGYADIDLYKLTQLLPRLTRLKVIDLTGVPGITVWSVQDTGPLSIFNANPAIDIFEFSADFVRKLQGITIPGFQQEVGKARRGWVFRKRDSPGSSGYSTPYTGVTPSKPSGFSFSALAQDRLRQQLERQHKVVKERRVETVCNDPSWEYVSRKVNMCDIGIGGNMTFEACQERGIYSYYGYHV